ncbi:MAG: rRNA maturation RNase YbeY [Flavisolibacter sp.]
MSQKAGEKIKFHYLNTSFGFRHRNELKSFIMKLFSRENQVPDSVHYIFCDDEYLLQLNQHHLKHNTYTDIITFPLSKKGEPLTAEIYVSIDRVKENAQKFKVTFLQELYRVIFHGALHLCGYEDKTKADSELMRKKEEQYLKLYLVPRGT